MSEVPLYVRADPTGSWSSQPRICSWNRVLRESDVTLLPSGIRMFRWVDIPTVS